MTLPIRIVFPCVIYYVMAYVKNCRYIFLVLLVLNAGIIKLNSKTIRIMSLNLARNYTLNKHINKLIKTEKPDIIALQEAIYAKPGAESRWDKIPSNGSRIVQEIAEKFKYNYSFGYTPNKAPEVVRYWGPVILSKFKILKSIRIPLGQRHRALIKVKVKPYNTMVTCYSTHLPAGWWRGYGLSFKAVKRGYNNRKRIIQSIIKELGNHPENTILAGDFNSIPFLNEVKPILKKLNDAFTVKGNGHGATYPSSIPLTRVDYIFTSKCIKILKCWVSDYYKTLDHRAVITDILIH